MYNVLGPLGLWMSEPFQTAFKAALSALLYVLNISLYRIVSAGLSFRPFSNTSYNALHYAWTTLHYRNYLKKTYSVETLFELKYVL